MKQIRVGLLLCAALLTASAASAQVSITGVIAGTVTDGTDAVLPGATVLLKDEGTGVQKQTVTNELGGFAFRDLSFGSYEITVSLNGFQTALYKKVVVESGRTTDLRIRLAVGALEQTVTVEGSNPVLEITSNAISSTLSNKSINELPLGGRNAFTFARLVPGAVAPQGTGSTHYNGMPGGTINPTIDGVNNSSNGFKSGGTSFFGTVPARLGAVEEVTVETAGLGGDAGVTGGGNLKFVTRRGTNQYRGSAFEQYRTEKLNANSFNNERRGLPKEELRRHDFGGSFGGPLVPKGQLRNKLFFFANYEQEYIPQTATQSVTLLTTEAQQGIFRYQTAAGEVRTANLLQIAASNGFSGTQDPTIAAMFTEEATARQYGTITENTTANALRLQGVSWLEPQKQINYYPTVRLDYHVKPTLALMTSYNRYSQDAQGRRLWPMLGYPVQLGTFDSGWWVTSSGFNWTLNSNLQNELRFGVQHSGDTNERGREEEHFFRNGVVNGKPARYTLPFGLAALSADQSPVIGKHYITTISDTFTLVRGTHTYSFGGNYRDTQWRDRSFDGSNSGGYLGLPRYAFGAATGDPILNVFTATNLPGATTADQASAASLYALLTGRLTQVQTGKVVEPGTLQYTDTIFRENWTSARFGGLFVQDAWRMTQDLTLNYGLRWEFNQPPFNHTATTLFPDDANIFGPSTDFFQPGVLNGVANPVIERGQFASNSDFNNVAPRVGFAWSPNFNDGLLATVFGKGRETVIRGGYDLTYFDEGTNMFASTAGNNPGQSQGLLLQPGSPGFAVGQLSLQSPLPPFVASPATYREVIPQSEITFGGGSINSMRENMKTGFVQAWNIGVQRLIAKNTVIEVRYVGNRGSNVWHTYNLNEVNIFENGFLNEFKKAQQNLALNLANGLTGFANNGLPGQSALPIFEAAFGARGAQAALPANQGFTNAGFITSLQQGEAGRLAGSIATNQTYYCRMVGNTFGPCATRNYSAAGPYAMNFFQLNPYAIGGNLNVVDDDASSKYHAMQVQMRRRYTNGLTATINYTLGKNWGDVWADNATQSHTFRTLREKSQDWGPAPFDVRQVLQAYSTYDLPFGKNRHFNIENGVADAFLGGWTVGGVLTAQSGTPFKLSSGRQTFNTSEPGVVLANGHTLEEIQSMIKISDIPNSVSRLWVDPKLVGPDGRANPEYLTVPTTPGEQGELLFLRGKNTWNLDMSLVKNATIARNKQITIHLTMTNVLNAQVWSTVGFLGDSNILSQTFGQTNNPINTARMVYSRFEFKF